MSSEVPTVPTVVATEAPAAKAKQTVYTCGYNCICTKKECTLQHSIKSFEERKFAANIYGLIPDIKEHTKEDNFETRKVNCFKGQLCNKSDCGFKHFLNYEGRQKFSLAMSVAEFTKSKKKPLTDDEKSQKIVEMQKRIDALEAKMEKVLTALSAK